MALINPHINFNGNAEEAFNFYKSVFGGEFAKIIRFKDISSTEYPVAENDATLLELLQARVPIRPTGRPGVAHEVGAGAGPEDLQRGQLALRPNGFAPVQISLREVQSVFGIARRQLRGALQMVPCLGAAPDAAQGGGVPVKQPQIAIGAGPVKLLFERG